MSSLSQNSTPVHRARRLIEVLEARGWDIYRTVVCEECYLQIRLSTEITVVSGAGGFRGDGLMVVHHRCASDHAVFSEAKLEQALDRIFGKRTANRKASQEKRRRPQ